MNPAGQAIREAALELRVNRCGNPTVGRGCLPAYRADLRITPDSICVLRRVGRDLHSHHTAPGGIGRGCDIDLSRHYELAERAFAPDSIPLGTVFVFINVHFAMLHTAS